MIQIDDKIVSLDIFEKQFVCDLNKCKGACCVEGDSGAPLTIEEVEILENEYEKIKPFLTKEGIDVINKEGVFYMDFDNEPVTTLVNNKECSFVTYDEKGITKCGIEKAYEEGLTSFKKPISCNLYPLRVAKLKNYKALNYNKWEICAPACDLGKELKVSVYKFLKVPLIRAFGNEFYEKLEIVDKELTSK